MLTLLVILAKNLVLHVYTVFTKEKLTFFLQFCNNLIVSRNLKNIISLKTQIEVKEIFLKKLRF
jgi:hypothetical protein